MPVQPINSSQVEGSQNERKRVDSSRAATASLIEAMSSVLATVGDLQNAGVNVSEVLSKRAVNDTEAAAGDQTRIAGMANTMNIVNSSLGLPLMISGAAAVAGGAGYFGASSGLKAAVNASQMVAGGMKAVMTAQQAPLENEVKARETSASINMNSSTELLEGLSDTAERNQEYRQEMAKTIETQARVSKLHR